MKIWIIGNAPNKQNIDHLVNKEDIVVRFNSPNPSCSLRADVLFIANAYENVRSRKMNINKKYLKKNTFVIYRFSLKGVFSLLKKQKIFKIIKYLYRFLFFILRNNLHHFKYKFFDFNLINKIASDVLKTDKEPSSGFIIIYYFLEKYKDAKIIMHNFTFEGWDGHPWEKEKKYVQRLIDENKILHI
ncbi:hypothetical protein NB640_02720 [Oxalobacter vibrioformis]|uniref:Uncharacterized protein n=1 Tax=Oxalobacter vibrioformis TaxID=933080 RepID=A0A9E9P4Y9_9BURK|nr:hypothetical protein [Oxalobacter vibrioformis]WAW10591.1 hypothetical protein NB640_02720 [Oxalobacter vibrioformis]